MVVIRNFKKQKFPFFINLLLILNCLDVSIYSGRGFKVFKFLLFFFHGPSGGILLQKKYVFPCLIYFRQVFFFLQERTSAFVKISLSILTLISLKRKVMQNSDVNRSFVKLDFAYWGQFFFFFVLKVQRFQSLLFLFGREVSRTLNFTKVNNWGSVQLLIQRDFFVFRINSGPALPGYFYSSLIDGVGKGSDGFIDEDVICFLSNLQNFFLIFKQLKFSLYQQLSVLGLSSENFLVTPAVTLPVGVLTPSLQLVFQKELILSQIFFLFSFFVSCLGFYNILNFGESVESVESINILKNFNGSFILFFFSFLLRFWGKVKKKRFRKFLYNQIKLKKQKYFNFLTFIQLIIYFCPEPEFFFFCKICFNYLYFFRFVTFNMKFFKFQSGLSAFNEFKRKNAVSLVLPEIFGTTLFWFRYKFFLDYVYQLLYGLIWYQFLLYFYWYYLFFKDLILLNFKHDKNKTKRVILLKKLAKKNYFLYKKHYNTFLKNFP